MPTNTHSGAIEGFGLLPAVLHAKMDKFDGVQLFVNDDLLDEAKFEQIINEILDSNLTNVVLHLPNLENLKAEYIDAANRFIARLPAQFRWHALIHLEVKEFGEVRNITFEEVPVIGGRKVCIENSKTGVFNKESVISAVRLARALGAGFVFDIGRILYPNESGEVNPDEVYTFIREVMQNMDPQTDVIHTAGKLAWEKRFRDAAAPFGAKGDITYPLKDALLDFHNQGGIVVFEHEDQEMILTSRVNLLKEP
ncbi:hypothetical protein DOJK_02131 [Patescibacteria group bacterium]|nr:hypothetical protein [Candidatus Dojkabacteria bacterium]CAG1023156.1 hypothetical protein DOJK_02131 [Patescibacteria group bacterium]